MPWSCGLCSDAPVASTTHAAQTTYPLTIKNCGMELTFKQAPSQTVSVGQSSTEMLYLLGLADKVTGTALWIGPVLKGYEDVDAKVERLADNDPSFESIIGKKPDLVATQFQWQIGPKGVVGTQEQFLPISVCLFTRLRPIASARTIPMVVTASVVRSSQWT